MFGAMQATKSRNIEIHKNNEKVPSFFTVSLQRPFSFARNVPGYKHK